METLRAGIVLVALIIFAVPRVDAAILTGDLESPPPANVNLTDKGNTDWIHWGRTTATEVNRKGTGLSQITNFTTIKSGSNVVRLTDSPEKYSWSDGNPNATVTNTPGGVYINNFDGPGRGFQFTAPADLIEHTLFIYLGEFNASGTLTASLNDGSGLTYSQTLTGTPNQTVQGLYTIDYQANLPRSLLTVKWVETADLGAADNITLQAVALCTPPLVPEPTTLLLFAAGTLLFGRRRKNF
ncbi:MAG TPA: PEP-CTERM sorting domain-containing protein [Tepidisphaeraceae bacterium]|nr:PEP-CTERM sorting domain-containing protein [Tepidisphaeraceae bacterium]